MLAAARPLLLVGGGKMGEALLGGWLRQGLPADAVLVVEPDAVAPPDARGAAWRAGGGGARRARRTDVPPGACCCSRSSRR